VVGGGTIPPLGYAATLAGFVLGGVAGCRADLEPRATTARTTVRPTEAVDSGGPSGVGAEGPSSDTTSPTLDGDRDGDGHVPPEDCDDADAAVFPGAADPAGDQLDSDCDGVDGRAGAYAEGPWALGEFGWSIAVADTSTTMGATRWCRVLLRRHGGPTTTRWRPGRCCYSTRTCGDRRCYTALPVARWG